MGFWRMSSYITRLTLGVKMRPTAAFTSMPNAQGAITGGERVRGFDDGTERISIAARDVHQTSLRRCGTRF